MRYNNPIEPLTVEKLMQYVWQHRLFSPVGLQTVDGRRVSILNPGLLNTASGPDFFNASVEIDGQKWVGNVEIHVRASDWHRHGHDHDPAYDSVILHVVDYDDMAIRRPDGNIIPQMRMPCSPNLNRDYHQLTDTSPSELTCGPYLKSIPDIYVSDWLSALAYERIYAKSERVEQILQQNSNNWAEAAYITFARALGFGLNSDPFERLARAMPIKFLLRHANSLISVEALLFGQAGVLDTDIKDPYLDRLRPEYEYLTHKFGLRKPQPLGWKRSGTRPQNFPYRRIAYLAQLVHDGFILMDKIMKVTDIESAREVFKIPVKGYWLNHYTFGGAPVDNDIQITQSTCDLLIINCLVPLLHTYAVYMGDYAKMDLAATLLEEIKPERNRIISTFTQAGLKVKDAFTSQAIIQLRREYCEKRKCLYCRFGHRYLSDRAIRKN